MTMRSMTENDPDMSVNKYAYVPVTVIIKSGVTSESYLCQ
jgi:hypothetical protein